VNFDLEMKNLASGESTRERERHLVRYFFPDQLESRLALSGFEIVSFGEWLTGSVPTDGSYAVYALAKAK
jgi:hypothetical protein